MGQQYNHPPTKEQRTRACKVLLGLIGLERLWTSQGPTPEAANLLLQYGGTLPNEEWIIYQIAWTVWGRETGIRLNEILRLQGHRLEAVTSLLGALHKGSEALEAWIKGQRPLTSSGASGGTLHTGALN
jgi:hypothetical protein